MTAALLLGAMCGLACLAAWRAAWPPPPPLHTTLHRLTRLPDMDTTGGVEAGIIGRVGRWLRATAEHTGLEFARLAPDLHLVGRSLERHLATKALLALLGALLPPAWAGLVALGGIRVGLAVTLGAAGVLAAVGFVTPDLLLRRDAAEKRRDATFALGSFLDLVVIALAGGAGVEQALRDAALIGAGQAFDQLRDCLDAAGLKGESVWAALGQLGAELGIPVLEELAASVALAGAEGARVRASLAAKAMALRARALAEAEAAAQSATERMAMPTVLLLTGFILLIGYPAVDAVLTGL